VIGKPPDGIALPLPFMLNVRRSCLQRSGAKDIALADLARKLFDVHSKVPRQCLLFAAHDQFWFVGVGAYAS
jgi:hypothetical protein